MRPVPVAVFPVACRVPKLEAHLGPFLTDTAPEKVLQDLRAS